MGKRGKTPNPLARRAPVAVPDFARAPPDFVRIRGISFELQARGLTGRHTTADQLHISRVLVDKLPESE